MRMIEGISISSADRERLKGLVRNRNTPQKVVWRARIVLLASDGQAAEAIAAVVGRAFDGAPLAAPLRGQGEWTGFEGRNPAFARQAVEP